MDRGLIPILLTVFLLAFGMSFVAPLVPLLLKGIGASSATIGQIATTYFLSFTVTTSFLGRLIERVGSKKNDNPRPCDFWCGHFLYALYA